MSDVLVVGSGPGGVNAAAALLERGHRVVMLDVGRTDDRYAPLVPALPFPELRRTDPGQHRYFLGDDFEGVPFGPVRVGAQLTPPRQYIGTSDDPRLPVDSDGFAVVQSLARGGLGAGWGAGVFPFDDVELRDLGVDLAALAPHYDRVVERIGVSGPLDDLAAFFPPSPALQPPLALDANAERLLAAYARRRARLNARGFFLGHTRLAVCTRRHRDRGPERYLDLAYWADPDRSVYRPQWTLDELERDPRFTYLPGRFVDRFTELDRGVRVHCRTDGGEEVHEASALVLAAGAIGSARIALASLERYDTPVPILCNPYEYVPTLHLRMLGRSAGERRHGMAQLTAMLRTGEGTRLLQAQVFSYRSLLTFKLMKEIPLGYRSALQALRLVMSSFAILGLHYEDRPTPAKRLVLRRGSAGAPDPLEIRYRPDAAEEAAQARDRRRLLAAFRTLGCIPLSTVRPGHGANMHYAGTLPMRPDGGDLTCDTEGRLRPCRNVYLADGSVFAWLPAKGLTFTLMACADRVGVRLGERLA
ncbi:MAG TPA: GMC oxidoreductase [Candidatus Limnocylindria bacterium]|nr:GMC oxidoreductase [Candidatus Limnocylindria bacterium]